MEIKTSHLACFTLCIILLSSILTQRFLMSYKMEVNDRMEGIAESLRSAKEMLLRSLHRYRFRNTTDDWQTTLRSPGVGTDIGEEHHEALLSCKNQSACIVPDLQLATKFNVYFCTKGVHQGIRFFYLVREGLLTHPNVKLLPYEDIHKADLVVVLPASISWEKSECQSPSLAHKLLVLEEFDGDTMYSPSGNVTKMKQLYGPDMRWYFMYFKRSYVRRRDGRFKAFRSLKHPDVYPMVYSIANTYAQHQFNHNRSIDITCTLRGNKEMSTRLRVQQWVARYVKEQGIRNVVLGELNHDTRTTISKMYFERLFGSKIIVTVNPAHWEGDFRLWESMATGALVMVDHLFVPYPYPLVDGEHVVFFDNNNETDFMTKLHYFHTHPQEARKIAVRGYLFAMKYHRTVSMMDYFLRSAHLKMLSDAGITQLPIYKYTGQFLLEEAKRQMESIAAQHKPGIFIHRQR